MTRPVLLATVGLPGSGKTTMAHQIAVQYNWQQISRDTLRHDLGCHPIGTATQEAHVTAWQDRIVDACLAIGSSIIVHDTNVRAVMPDGIHRAAARLYTTT